MDGKDDRQSVLDQFLVYMQYLWLPLIPLMLLPATRPFAFGIGACMITINVVARRRLQHIADDNTADVLTRFLRPGETLVEHAIASEWQWIGTTFYLQSVAYMALTDERLLVVDAHMGLNNVKPTDIVFEARRADVRLAAVKGGCLATKLRILGDGSEPIRLAFWRASRLPATRIVDALPESLPGQ